MGTNPTAISVIQTTWQANQRRTNHRFKVCPSSPGEAKTHLAVEPDNPPEYLMDILRTVVVQDTAFATSVPQVLILPSVLMPVIW